MSSSRNAVDKWAVKQGFGPVRKFEGTRTKIGGDPAATHAGFYLLMFKDDSYYLGESINLRSRMGGHSSFWGNEIEEVRFIRENLSKQQLQEVERLFIHELNKTVPNRCRNKTHAAVSFGTDKLEEFLDPADQTRWLSAPAEFNASDNTDLKAMTEAQAIKYKTAASRYVDHPAERATTQLLRNYLTNCVPVPKQTEFHGWNVSTGTYGGRRLLCVCVGRMEAFVVFRDLHGFINVRKSSILNGAMTQRAFAKLHPDVAVTTVSYDDSGADTLLLKAKTPEAFSRLMNDPQVLDAAARLVLDVMRKHPSVYTRYHCPQVVERVFPDVRRASSDEIDGLDAIKTLHTNATQPIGGESAEASTSEPRELPDVVTEEVPDDVDIAWFVNAGPITSKRNTLEDFVTNGEWRMDPSAKFEGHVQAMLQGERIAVRKRRNATDGVPFATRGNKVSVMDILLTGIITKNPGDGCSVKVRWDPQTGPRRWYLYTNQDPVWAVPHGLAPHNDELVAFTFDSGQQNIDSWRNRPFWRDRFGD